MTSKESLRNLKQEILTPNFLTDYEKDECIDVIQQDLERLEKLEEEYNNLKKGIKIFLEYYDVYLFDEDGLGSCEIGVATIGEDFYISKEKYLLLKEVLGNE